MTPQRNQGGDWRNNAVFSAMRTDATSLRFFRDTMAHYDGRCEDAKERTDEKDFARLDGLETPPVRFERFMLTMTVFGWRATVDRAADGHQDAATSLGS